MSRQAVVSNKKVSIMRCPKEAKSIDGYDIRPTQEVLDLLRVLKLLGFKIFSEIPSPEGSSPL